MRRKFRANEDAPSHDSFLDIVANLVGILIILIMVIGVRARGALVESKSTEATPEVVQDLPDVDASRKQLQTLNHNVHEVEHQLAEFDRSMSFRQEERDQLNQLLHVAERQLEEHNSKLDKDEQERLKLQSRFRTVSLKLKEVTDRRRFLEADKKESIELEHLPTPMAKTVFGREEHFRLEGGRVVYVPLNYLTERLRNEVPKKLWRLKEVPEFTGMIGPIQDFHLQYTMQRRAIRQTTQAGTIVRQVAELERFVLLPVEENLGESLEKALADGSQFRQILETMRPNSTVVTVWTYPDSFGDYRELKAWLFAQGYSTAARPLPTGQPITGSPQGTRSAAE